MAANIKARLEALEGYIQGLQPSMTTFTVAGGAAFRTQQGPLEYLIKHGSYTPDGRRIVQYIHPVEGIDELSRSIYQTIDEAIDAGRLDLPPLEGDKPGAL